MVWLIFTIAKFLDLDYIFGGRHDLPDNLFLIRHGESEGNVAVNKSINGDDSAFSEEFRDRHSKTWKLTELGIEQAKSAGQWLKDNGYGVLDHYYVSPYHRTLMTAAYLGLKNALWHRPKVGLRERDRGRLEVKSVQEVTKDHPDTRIQEGRDVYLYRYPGGESLADVELRARHFFRTLEREASNQNVVVVTHGEMMWSFRSMLEGLSSAEFTELNKSHDDLDRIHNCQIIQYSRIDHVTGEKHQYYVSMRSICPWDQSKSSNEWTYIERKKMTNEDLLESIGMKY